MTADPGRALGPLQLLRWAWGQLTSMRTALMLLFLLALATVPGSMIPQQSISPISVLDFKRDNPFWDSILEPLGFYDVYTSPAFSAVYLLLFVSLIGCILVALLPVIYGAASGAPTRGSRPSAATPARRAISSSTSPSSPC